jgi:hypothetical protein
VSEIPPVSAPTALVPAPSRSPATASELIEFIRQIVVEHFKASGRPLAGAVLANMLRDRYPELSYHTIGLTRLSDAIKVGEQNGSLTRRHDVPHLEVLPGPAAGLSSGISSNPAGDPPRLRDGVWKAFVFHAPNVQTFYERTTGLLKTYQVTHQAEQIAEVSADPRYVAIPPISSQVQQGWAREFVEERSLTQSPVEEDSWWIKFPNWLRSEHADLEPDWRRFRAERTVEHITAWCRAHEVSFAALVHPARPPIASQSSQSKDSIQPESQELSHVDPELAQWRRAAIAAVSEMSMNEIDELSIKVKHLRRWLRPR